MQHKNHTPSLAKTKDTKICTKTCTTTQQARIHTYTRTHTYARIHAFTGRTTGSLFFCSPLSKSCTCHPFLVLLHPSLSCSLLILSLRARVADDQAAQYWVCVQGSAVHARIPTICLLHSLLLVIPGLFFAYLTISTEPVYTCVCVCSVPSWSRMCFFFWMCFLFHSLFRAAPPLFDFSLSHFRVSLFQSLCLLCCSLL